MTSLTITNPAIIDFFNKNPMYDPERFFLQLISTYENNKLKPMAVVAKNTKTDNIQVSKDELLQFYEEYQYFISQKKNMIQLSREYNTNFQRNVNRPKFQKLDDFFSKHLNVKCQTYVCRVCNKYNVSTKKGLTTHERICRSKNITINNDDDGGSHEEEDDMENSEGSESDNDEGSVEVEAVVLPPHPPTPVVVLKRGK